MVNWWDKADVRQLVSRVTSSAAMTVDIENVPVFRQLLTAVGFTHPWKPAFTAATLVFRQELPQFSLRGRIPQDGLSGCVAAGAFPECRNQKFPGISASQVHYAASVVLTVSESGPLAVVAVLQSARVRAGAGTVEGP
jgi:hypothetical protein